MANPFVRSLRSSPIGGAVLLFFALAFLPGSLAADVGDRDRARSRNKKPKDAAALQQALDFDFMNVNNVLLIINNDGIIGLDQRVGEGVGRFPGNSPNNYVFASGFWIGGIREDGVKVVSTSYDPSQGESEFRAGRFGGTGQDEEVRCSDQPDELAAFPADFRDPATGEPIVFSQKDCVIVYFDANQFRTVREPVGIEVRQRTMAFTFGLLSQVVFVIFDIENKGTTTLTDAFIAPFADMDIGDNFNDDRCSAIPFVPPGENNSSDETVETNLGFCWDSNFNEGEFNPNPPGFVAITFFQGPVSDQGDTLGVVRFTLTTNPGQGRPQPDPDTDDQQYDLLAGIGARAPFIDATASDMRFAHISGPITFAPGDIQQVVTGYIWANVTADISALTVSPTRCFPVGLPCFLPDPNDPALSELIQIQRAAQVIFDADFLAPAPPPKPDITLIPGDQQVTVVFSDVSGIADPFFPIASDPTSPAFDPLFREFDFEGYVVVRSTSGDPADVDTIAIFDLANDVVIIEDTTFQLFQIGDSVLTLPTAVATIIELPNTGLQFSFVDDDRGEGLINGLVYFYDVVPFDFNPSFTLRGPTISLSSGIAFQPREAKSVRPRSNSSAFRAADLRFEALETDGSACSSVTYGADGLQILNEPTATVNAETGHYTDFIDCSNAVVAANLAPLRDVNIPSGEFIFVIDSILPSPSNPFDDDNGFDLAFGLNRVWFHWEDASGALATVIQPNVGFFDQGLDFFGAAETPVAFGLDTDPTDVGPDLSIGLIVASDFSVIEDLEINGQSLHLGELGGTHVGEARPHRITGSSLAATVNIGMVRGLANSREYSHPGPYAQGGTSYELTWSVSGGQYSGTLRKLPGGEVVPITGPKGPDNPSTPANNIPGYNWGFVAPAAPATVRAALSPPQAGPTVPSISLAVGNTFGIYVPGQSVYIDGITDLPEDGDRWTFLIDTGSQRASFGREGSDPSSPNLPVGPFLYEDGNDAFEQGLTLSPVPWNFGIVNVYPGARWKLTVAGGSNDPGDTDLALIKTVPNPYVANAIWDFSQDNQRIEFVNLPPVATIRIYTISGNLVRTLEHTNGSGTEVWDLRTRFNLKAASGTYYWHVTTPDGETTMGLTSVIQNELGAN